MQLVVAESFQAVKELYLDVIEKTEGMEQHARWVYGQHPTDSMLKAYIDNKEMYVYMDGDEIAGVIAITMYQGEDYQSIAWESPLQNEEVAVLHIFAIRPAYQGKGVGRKLIEAAIILAKEQKKKAVRLDALESNTPAHQLYEGLGFTYRGRKHLYAENTGWTDFVFYELSLVET